jgi:CDP-diglyceride synthetase
MRTLLGFLGGALWASLWWYAVVWWFDQSGIALVAMILALFSTLLLVIGCIGYLLQNWDRIP